MSGTHILKDTFYREKLLSLSSTEQTIGGKKKTKELGKNPLTPNQIARGLSHLGKAAKGNGYEYLSLNLADSQIFSIEGIENYKGLQNIDFSNNSLTSLKPLSSLKYLLKLNVANNKISKLLDFVAPLNLEDVDFSDNEIKEIPDLSKFRFLKKLNLTNNFISKIEGLNKNMNLQELRLDNNKLTNIENLENLNLISLFLQGNNIKTISGLSFLPQLRTLDLSRNQIVRLSGLSDLQPLRNLHLSDNLIKNVKELHHLESLSYLSILDLCFNLIQQRRFYRFQALFILPQLRILDGMSISAEEIVKAECFYGLEKEERKNIFKKILEEEEFVDRRINHSEMIEPESDSENEDIEFVDQYDIHGQLKKNKSLQQTIEGSLSGSLKPFRSENNF